MNPTDGSTFQNPTLSLEQKLEKARAELLDLGARNRLLNIPKTKNSRFLEMVDERSEHIYSLLVKDKKTFTFLHSKEAKEDDQDDAEESVFFYPASQDDNETQSKHLDTKLQTKLTAKGLQKRLLDLYHDSKTLEEEQGVNILYLSLGTLKWVDPANKENIRLAPLILIPVSLERGNAGERFKLTARSEEIIPNLSLEAFLERVHQIILPEMKVDEDDEINIHDYMQNVNHAISLKTDWAVNENDITLGLFSFAKFLMYRDLDPSNWPEEEALTSQYLIRSLMEDGFEDDRDLLSEEGSIDPVISPKDMLHIMDSDSSQTLAIHEVRRGKNLVIQGPPGTGKSQTIANIIASAIADGKTVLFVAEKMAALEVVKRRLDYAGVGDACLELHSNKANKRLLLEELKRVWELGSPRGEYPDVLLENLTDARDVLNAHPARIHRVFQPSGLTPYQVMGHLVRLRQSGQAPTDFDIHGFDSWTENDLAKRLNLIEEIIERIQDIGLPDNHPWRGVGREEVLPGEIERLLSRLTALVSQNIGLKEGIAELAALTGSNTAIELYGNTANLLERAGLIKEAPLLPVSALTSPVWQTSTTQINDIIDVGKHYEECLNELKKDVFVEGLSVSLQTTRDELETLPADLSPSAFAASRNMVTILPKLENEVQRLVRELGSNANYSSPQDIKRLIELSARVAEAPDASPEAFVASVWEHGVEQAAELVNNLHQLAELKNKIESAIFDIAWETDVIQARKDLAIHTGLFRFTNSEWRRSRALVRSVIKDTAQPIQQQINLLDDLIKAQTLRKKIIEQNEFASKAFSHHWRGEESNSDSLRALVEWMGTLSDVGPEARSLASQLADRDSIRHLSNQLKETLEQAAVEFNQLWRAFGQSPEVYFENHYSIQRVSVGYMHAMAQKLERIDTVIRPLLRHPVDKLSEKLSLVEHIMTCQQLKEKIDSYNELASKAFSDSWAKSNSDWQKLDLYYEWFEKHGELRFIVAKINDRVELVQKAEALHRISQDSIQQIKTISLELSSTPEELFNVNALDTLTLSTVIEKMQLWISHSEQLSKWVSWQHRSVQAQKAGLKEVIDRLSDGRLALEGCYSSVERTYYESLLNLMVEKDPELARFDGELHSRKVADFAQLDLKRIKAASFEVVRAHHRRIPSKAGGAGPVGILRAEMARKRGHMPIRQLMLKAGAAIQALKPVMMMSPLSVAQFLIPGKQKFDLLVMDEASQIQPVDAIGAIARCQQVVVVGDERQLPPTSFFSRMTEASNDDEDDTTQVADIESVLGLFVARGLPQRMLRWHYRSRHQSLIAVSNSQFYENKLFIVPSPYTKEAGMGLQFHHVPDGVFESGGSGSNPVEAKRVATAILQHAQTNPGLSLGIATFSVAQRKAIQDELELLRQLNPQYEDFFHAHPSEPFFIKNLENVQGDERDVIMISVGYARNAQGYMAMRFGPLGSQGGERRLNVLISRAKRRCEVFASITDEDIDLERAKGAGVLAFKLFLQYARTGRLSLAHRSGRQMDSIFEEQVASALQSKGFQVHPQVGIAGFFIDLGIADPDMPGRYLLGIECDGSAYHSSRSARERDRLRQAVLEDHGWIIHRIWSTDWFQRPEEQLQRVLTAIENAKRELQQRRENAHSNSRAVPVEIITVEREDVIEVGLEERTHFSSQTVEYQESQPQAQLAYALHEMPVGLLAELIENIVLVESPIHINEVVTRLRTAWGLQRSGARIESVVRSAVAIACKKGNVYGKEDFLLHQNAVIAIRNRQNVASGSLRKPEFISSMEIAIGINEVVNTNFGATEDEVILAVSRMLGFKATSSVLKKTIAEVIAQQVEEGVFKFDEMLIVPVEKVETNTLPNSATR